MPCYDKKLEASRPDFYCEADGTRDVDCVLTTGELAAWMQSSNICANAGQPEVIPSSLELPCLLQHPGSSSGSYMHSLLNDASLAAKDDYSDIQLHVRVLRTKDFCEFTLHGIPNTSSSAESTVLFKGATCYGFRNVQNLVRKLPGTIASSGPRPSMGRRRKAPLLAGPRVMPSFAGAPVPQYDYVEVMACPSGCINGGGQLPLNANASVSDGTNDAAAASRREPAHVMPTLEGDEGIDGWDPQRGSKRAALEHVESLYWETPSKEYDHHDDGAGNSTLRRMRLLNLEQQESGLIEDRIVQEAYEHTLRKDSPSSAIITDNAAAFRRGLFRTSYHAVASVDDVGLAVQW